MGISIWDNLISRDFEKRGKKIEALLFRIMNLSGKVSLLFLVLGLLQIAFVLDKIILNIFGIVDIISPFAIICLVISSLVFSVFGFAAAGYAYLRKEYLWAVGMVLLSILSVPYIYLRTRDMKRKK